MSAAEAPGRALRCEPVSAADAPGGSRDASRCQPPAARCPMASIPSQRSRALAPGVTSFGASLACEPVSEDDASALCDRLRCEPVLDSGVSHGCRCEPVSLEARDSDGRDPDSAGARAASCDSFRLEAVSPARASFGASLACEPVSADARSSAASMRLSASAPGRRVERDSSGDGPSEDLRPLASELLRRQVFLASATPISTRSSITAVRRPWLCPLVLSRGRFCGCDNRGRARRRSR